MKVTETSLVLLKCSPKTISCKSIPHSDEYPDEGMILATIPEKVSITMNISNGIGILKNPGMSTRNGNFAQ